MKALQTHFWKIIQRINNTITCLFLNSAQYYSLNACLILFHCLKSIIFKNVISLFLERKVRENERERKSNVWLSHKCPPLGTWPATQACALTTSGTSDL